MATPSARVRFAPSPTGSLHIGGARTALFNQAFARRVGGVFVLRVEDTDRERSSQEHEEVIYEGLRWLGMRWDEGPDVGGDFGPYRQSERTGRHLGVASALQQAGWAYPCFCSSERLATLREEQLAQKQRMGYDGKCRDLALAEIKRRIDGGETPVLRFRVPEGETRFVDHIRGEVLVQNAEVDDWVMVRADGSPTYNFVCVVDDSDMEITHVIRGEDHLTNTPKQILLYKALDLDVPEFAHLPLMLGKDKKKLSKRTGDTALQTYRDKGYPPAAVMNFLCLQGWALDGATEVFSLDELEAKFELGDVSKGGSVFDPDKFLWLAGEYIRREPVAELAEHCLPFMVASGVASEAQLRGDWERYTRAVAMEQERIALYSELPARLAYLFANDAEVAYEEKAIQGAQKHDAAIETLGAYREWVAGRLNPDADPAQLGADTKAWVSERGLKIPVLFQPLRCALTGKPGGPDLFETMLLLGADATLGRLDVARERLAAD